MQCPFKQLYNEPEFSEDSYSEEDCRAYELNYPCCKCLERENQFNNPYTIRSSKEKQTDCPCCICIEEKKEKPKVKGKFGLAYVVQTPKDNSFKPLGWQVEFQDTPSQIDRNCEKMLKWVTCPPLGECNTNLEANFLWCPGECKELLDTETEQEPMENCCLIEIPKLKCLAMETKQTACVCQRKEKNCSCSRNKPLKQKYPKNNDPVLQKQFERFMLCKKCCKALTKCTCSRPSSTNACYCERKQLKSKYPPSPSRSGDQKALDICKHCRDSKSYYCTIEESICPSCGKVMEKNCYVKENCVCDSREDSLDYIPKREPCPRKKYKQVKDGCSQVRTRDVGTIEKDNRQKNSIRTPEKLSHTEKRVSSQPQVENKTIEMPTHTEKRVSQPKVENKTVEKPIQNERRVSQSVVEKNTSRIEIRPTHAKETPAAVENKTPVETSEPQREVSDQETEIKDDHKNDSEEEVAVSDLINFDDVEEPQPKPQKKFTTKATGDEPSLLERIKQAHHKQMHEIHPEIPL